MGKLLKNDPSRAGRWEWGGVGEKNESALLFCHFN